MSKIDMHIHTNYSDGEHSPNEIIKLAKKEGLETISFTDHDTVAAYDNITINANIKIIPGIEINCQTRYGKLHILGYNIDINNYRLTEKITKVKKESKKRFESFITLLAIKYHITFGEEEIASILNSDNKLCRKEIATLCTKYHYANNINEAFAKYLLPLEQYTYKNKEKPTPEEAITLIKEAGGISVLAHPNTIKLNPNLKKQYIASLAKKGLAGIECYHSTYDSHDEQEYLVIAQKLNLLVSGGSDFHGEHIKPKIKLGSGIDNNLNIQELSIVKKIEKVCPSHQ